MNESTTHAVRSADGTTIGYAASGTGPVLVAVHGGTADRSRWTTALPLLERHFTVWAVDRRGRGLSGDADAYEVESEAQDLIALVRAAGPDSVLLAHSYGGVCALAAADRLPELAALVLYDPAFATPGHDVVDEATLAEVERAIAEGDADGALTIFFRDVISLPDDAIDLMRTTPVWEARKATVHTMLREGRAAQSFRPDPAALSALPFPVLVLHGSESPPWLQAAAAATHVAIPSSELVPLEGQAHMAMDSAPEAFVREIVQFLERAGRLAGTRA